MADIELVIKIPEELAEKGHWYTDEEMWTVIKAAQNGTPIPDNASNGEWVDVNERLPEEYGEYLITWKNPKYPKTYIGICECEITDVYDHEHNRFEVEWLFDGYITTAYPDSYVVAWQPLPEPYQKGGKE